jgi:hypothetical protein
MLSAMHEVGKLLVVIGALTAGIGAVLWKTGGLGFLKHFGHLPEDLSWEKGGGSVHFPLTTCLLLSALLSFVAWLLRK